MIEYRQRASARFPNTAVLLHGEDASVPKYNGTIDEVRIYNRVLVDVVDGGLGSPSDTKNLSVSTTGEILKNYNHGKSKHS